VNFYPFMRKNIPFWFNAFIEKPATVNAIFRGFQYMGEAETEQEKMWRKPWLQRTLTAKIGKDRMGNPIYATGTGLSIENMEQVLGIGRSFKSKLGLWVSAMNPVFRIPLEQLTGRNFYFDNNIADYNKAYQIMEQIPPLKALLKVQEVRNANGEVVRWSCDGNRLYWLQQVYPIMQAIPMLDGIINGRNRTSSRTAVEAVSTWLTGLNITSGDPATWARVIQRNILNESLRRAHEEGRLGKLEEFYPIKGMNIPEEEANLYKAQIERYHQTVRGK